MKAFHQYQYANTFENQIAYMTTKKYKITTFVTQVNKH